MVWYAAYLTGWCLYVLGVATLISVPFGWADDGRAIGVLRAGWGFLAGITGAAVTGVLEAYPV
jgi:hypothetical protein